MQHHAGSTVLAIHNRIDILDAVSSGSRDGNCALDFGYTKAGEEPTPTKCYCSKYPLEQIAILKIPLSEVAEVRLLSRNEEWG